jgi:YidC/Oxa1 family membrane protein insertase
MRSNLFNVFMFVGAVVGLYFLMSYAEKNWFPPKPAPEKKESSEDEAKRKAEEDAKRKADEERLREEKKLAAAAAGGYVAVEAEEARLRVEAEARRVAAQRESEEKRTAAGAAAGMAAVTFQPRKPPDGPKETPRVRGTLIAFGDDTFYNKVLLTTEGGGVQQVILTRFNESDRLGREVKGPDGKPVPLHLIPGVKRDRPKYLEEMYPTPNLRPGKLEDTAGLAEPCYTVFHYASPEDNFPDAKLGREEWDIPPDYRDADGNPKPKVVDGVHEMVFEKLLESHAVKLRKTFTLGPKDYHIGFKLNIERVGTTKIPVRLQLSGPRGLPIEGEWYTTAYRVALIGWTDRKGRAGRHYESAADVAVKRGGDEVPRGDSTFKYMAVATQYFTSAVAIDDTADVKHPWAFVRATTELPFGTNSNPNMPYFDDLTIRAKTETLDIDPGKSIEHKYVIYNGPAKVRLLGMMEANRGTVDETLVKRYQDGLGLKTVTDFQSPTWLGSFANAIYWTDLVIAFTNLMHGFLATIHGVVPSWALSIIVLTIVVRLLLFIPSRKQTQMNMKMMEVQKRLAPQFEELKKKHEGDPRGYNHAKMKLMMANGVNPFAALGGCLLLLAQMPIMMGLYFCLQESVFFRLESFLWVDNLAAPDMTLWWGEGIPYISWPDGVGGMLYLGPYLNILPIIAVVLMFWQQLKMLPPPTDDQSRQQRFMMKMMMFLMPLFFYKFAAGLAIYFIVGTLWGMMERQFVPKPDLSKTMGGGDAGGKGGGGGGDGPNPDAAPPKPKGLIGRMLEAARERMEEMKRRADEQSKRQIRNEKGGADQGQGQGGDQNQNPNRRDNRRDKKKKRRK